MLLNMANMSSSWHDHGRGSPTRDTVTLFSFVSANVSYYPVDFINRTGLYGYVIVSAQALKQDFVCALPGIPKALKAVFVNLDTHRKHVESFLADDYHKAPKSPKYDVKVHFFTKLMNHMCL